MVCYVVLGGSKMGVLGTRKLEFGGVLWPIFSIFFFESGVTMMVIPGRK